jgi:hypothetical protein
MQNNKRAGKTIAAKAGTCRRRTGIVANRGGSSYSEKEAENEGVRDRCNSKLAQPGLNPGCLEVVALYR